MLELYHNNISVCAQKVRIVLAEKNLFWTNHHLSLAKGDQLTAEFKKDEIRAEWCLCSFTTAMSLSSRA